MIEPVIISFWIEINSRLYHKTITKVYNECEPIVTQLYEQYEESEHKLVAVKCDTFQDYKAKMEYFDDER
jgi:hypothetical protein|tara:strand:- start:17 stop:226 length:210 start_codon:yes stop_codon:yes gene_type:complete